MNTFFDAMQFRHACKLFDDSKKISDENIQFILDMGRLSPSSFGMEPWKFLAISSDELKAKLKPCCWNQAQITTCSYLVVILYRKPNNFNENSEYLIRSMKRKAGDDEVKLAAAKQRFLSHRLTEARADNDNWAQMQCYLASANMMTAAASIGVDSCAIEGFLYKQKEAVLYEYAPDAFNKDEFAISHSIALGYRGKPQQDRIRWNFDDVVTFIK